MESLAASYDRCRQLHRQHGRTYYLATRLLPGWKRRHVHALYGFTRYADEIVDRAPGDGRAARLADWSSRFLAGLDGEPVDDPLLPAVLHTIRVFDLDLVDFRKFLASMAMDLEVTGYPSYADLLGYMDGSAAVIGTMMLPILESADPAAAREPARQLGLAFQLTNFIRDVAEDAARDRVYLPAADRARFGVRRTDLSAPAANTAVRRLVAFEITRAREHYRHAAAGITLLPPRSRRCIRLASAVYGGILDAIERRDYDVLSARAVVPRPQRAAAVARELARPA